MKKITTQLVQVIYYQCCQGHSGWHLDENSLRDVQIIICEKNKAAPASQLMAPLPQIRLKLNIRAFSNAGIDFARAFLTIHGGKRGGGEGGIKTKDTCVSLYNYHLRQFIWR